MTTPNKITIGRICLIPVFVIMALEYGRSISCGAPLEWMRWSAIIIFIIAAASDGVDGYIARRFNQVSRLGIILDPIADKGLLLTGVITLSFSAWPYEFPLWFPVLIISRDIVVVGGLLTLRFLQCEIKVKPTWAGKAATVAQMVAIGFVMLIPMTTWQFNLGGIPVSFLDLPVLIAGILTLVSGIGYVRYGIGVIHSRIHDDPSSPGNFD